MQAAVNVRNFTVVQLKEKLSELGLSATGNKAELIARLDEADPQWADKMSPPKEASASVQVGDSDSESVQRVREMCARDVELSRREKEIAERELQLARREIEMLRELQNLRVTDARPVREERGEERPRVSVTMVADLLGYFQGCSGEYECWEKQLRLLGTTYRLEDDYMKILIGMRLKGKALEWLHSRPEHVQMSVERLLTEMREMFQFVPNKINLRRKFEQRIWKKDETFAEYVHDKVILGHRVSISEDEMLEYILEGIPDVNLRNQARISRFTTKSELLQAFERISLRGSGPTEGASKKIVKQERCSQSAAPKSDGAESTQEKKIFCYNCGRRDHRAADCPTKSEGPKCFNCQQRGHRAQQCPQPGKEARSNCVTVEVPSGKPCKRIVVARHPLLALIDTGSDLTIMRAEQYVKIGSPPLDRKVIRFRGVGSGENVTLGEFNSTVTIDGQEYPILIRVVPDVLCTHDLIVGTDFLNNVELVIRDRDVFINPLPRKCDEIAEICKIDIETPEIDLSHVIDGQTRDALHEVISNYVPNKTRETGVKMSIVLKDDEPVYERARRLSPSEREIVNTQISEWIRDGIAQPSLSEYASPVVLVKKKDGAMRLCIDYRKLNTKIVRDRYPLPLIEDQLDALQNSVYFSTLDLKNGFFHVTVDEASRKYTAFIVPDGHYEFTKVPFGLCNSPSVFQRFINAVFKELIHDRVVIVYMDDLIVPSVEYRDGLERIKKVLKVASEAGLLINWRKCKFLERRVEFLGHIVDDGRIFPSDHKTKAVRKFPEPVNAKQVQSFLGLTGYFRKFVPQYSNIARPLTNLLRKDIKFEFGESERDAFITLKELLCNQPVLRLYRIGVETELHTDASMYGYGAILLQRENESEAFHPVYFWSGKTTTAEAKYTSYELEVLAVVKALRRFRVYLLGISFKIVTDCRAFMLTMKKKDLCVRVARWALALEEFDYKIEHRPGKSMVHVDALSRHPSPTCFLIDRESLTLRLRRAQQEDVDVKRIFDRVEKGELNGYIIRGNILFKEIDDELRLVVPKRMWTQVIRRCHEVGHFSVAKTKTLVEKEYWIPGVANKIEKVVRNCVLCVLSEGKSGKQEGFLMPIDKGEKPFDTYHVDHLGPLPSTKKKYNHIFVVIDGFTKFVWLYPTKTTAANEVIDRLRKQSITFGNPRRIVSDRGSAFTSKDFATYCNEEKIRHVLITTGVPRANGQVERVNRTLIPLLTKLSNPKKDEWYRFVDRAQQCLNVTMHRSIGTSPFNLLFGAYPRLRDDTEIRALLEGEWVSEFQAERDETRAHARENIEKIQRENRKTFNKKRTECRDYCENDLVAIKRTQRGPGLKFATKYLGPYRISRVLRGNRYVVHKVGEHEGPAVTSSSADFMKPWLPDLGDDESESEGDDDGDSRGRLSLQDGRV